MCKYPAQSSVGRGNHPNGRAVTGVAGQAGGVTDATDVRALLADVAGIGPFFAVDTGRVPPGEGWVPVTALADPGDPLADRIAAVGAALGTDGRVAASIAFQGFAAQVVAPLFAAVAVHGVLPEASAPSGRPDNGAAAFAATLHWRPGGAGPWLWWPGDAGRVVPCPEPSGLRTLLTGVLAPMVVAVRARVPVAERVLWGNVASAVASARQLVAAGRPDAAPRAAEVARHLLATPPLAATATLRAPDASDVGWSFRRRSCCLFHRVPGGGLCGDCVLRGPRGERRTADRGAQDTA
jgi:hypothetical protein